MTSVRSSRFFSGATFTVCWIFTSTTLLWKHHQKWTLKSGTYIHFESKAQLQAIALVKWQLIMMASQEVSSSGGVQFRLTLRWFKNRVRPQLHYFWYHIVSWGQLKSQLLTEFLTRSSDNDFANAFADVFADAAANTIAKALANACANAIPKALANAFARASTKAVALETRVYVVFLRWLLRDVDPVLLWCL